MRMTRRLIAAAYVVLGLASAHAATREEKATELRDEIATRQMTCTVSYGQRDACGHQVSCNKTLEKIADFQLDLAHPDGPKRAVYKWWRYVSGSKYDASCARALLSTDTYCKTLRLVKAFDPHTRCPSDGGTNATCWVNPDYERSPLLLKDEEGDWYQSCPLSEE